MTILEPRRDRTSARVPPSYGQFYLPATRLPAQEHTQAKTISVSQPVKYVQGVPNPGLTKNQTFSSTSQVSAPARPARRHSHIVLKFGGTSVAKQLRTIVDNIVPSCRANAIPILVCSAQSYTVKEEGTTQRLLAAIDAALSPAEMVPHTLISHDPSAYSHPFGDPHVPMTSFESLSIFSHGSRSIMGSKREHATFLTPPPTPPERLVTPGDDISPVVEPIKDSTASTAYHTSPLAEPQETSRSIIAGILGRHLRGARTVILREDAQDSGIPDVSAPARLGAHAEEIFSQLGKDIKGDCERVLRMLDAVQALGEISPRTRDAIISVGELIACRTVVAALHSRDIPACLVDLTNLAGSSSGISTQPLDGHFFDNIVAIIKENILRKISTNSQGEVPVIVVTGFFGPIPGSLLEQIGRGYTDVCSALCARALSADELQIWKEVDGVFSADPRKITQARLLPDISYDQAKLLTSYGSEVVHHLAIKQARSLNIPIVVKNVADPTKPGTRILSGQASPTFAHLAKPAEPSSNLSVALGFAVTTMKDLVMVRVHFDDWEVLPEHPTVRVVNTIRKYVNNNGADVGLELDLVTSSQGSVCFMVSDSKSRSAAIEAGFGSALSEIGREAKIETTPGMGYLQVVIVDPAYRVPQICWKIFGALSGANIDVAMMSHGPVVHGVGCVIAERDVMRAASVVHDALVNLSSQRWVR